MSLTDSVPAAQANIWQAKDYVRSWSYPQVPPVDAGPVPVSVGLSLTAIREVDTDKNELEIVAMVSHQWTNPQLAWRGIVGGPANRTRSVSLPKEKLWVPDVVAYNAVTAPELLSPELVVVSENGTVHYVPLMRIRFKCYLGNVDTDRGSVCVLRLGPWTQDANTVMVSADTVHLDAYDSEPDYEIVEATSVSYLINFQCCEEAYSQARFSFNIKKRESGLGAIFDW